MLRLIVTIKPEDVIESTLISRSLKDFGWDNHIDCDGNVVVVDDGSMDPTDFLYDLGTDIQELQ